MKNDITPRIYVACLASYNNSLLHGRWIDATSSKDEIYDEINEMLSVSPIPNAEEWAIHDYEGFERLDISEHEDIESVCEKARFIEEYGDLGSELFEHYGNIETAKEALEDHYHGEWESELEFATDLFDEIYLSSIPDNINSYIDYESFCRDLFINDYFSIDVGYKTHVFSCF